MKFLLFASDGLSLSTGYLTGGGLRSLMILKMLEKYGQVNVVEPAHCRNKTPEYGSYEVNKKSQFDCITEYDPDCVFFLNVNAFCLRDVPLRAVLIMDVHGPIFLESALISSGDPLNELGNFYRNASCADGFTTVSVEQKNSLAFMGLLNPSQKIACDDNVFIIPQISQLGEYNPRKIARNEKYLVGYFGSIYPWINPFDFLNDIADNLNDRARLIIRADAHKKLPNVDFVGNGLQLLGHKKGVECKGLVSRKSLEIVLANIDCVVDLSSSSSERHIAFNTRVAEFLELGIPTFVNDYSSIGALFKSFGLPEFVVTKPEDTSVKIFSFLAKSSKVRANLMQELKTKSDLYFSSIRDEDRLMLTLKSSQIQKYS